MSKLDEFRHKYKSIISEEIEKPNRYYFNIEKDDLKDIADYLINKLEFRLSTASATEMENHMEILYHFSNDDTGRYFCPRIILEDKDNPELDSISEFSKGAKWIEREVFDFWGIKFKGHPNMKRLLAENHPQDLDKPLRYEEEK